MCTHLHTLFIQALLLLMHTQNHYYHTLERDRDPRGIEVDVCTDTSPCVQDKNGSPMQSERTF